MAESRGWTSVRTGLKASIPLPVAHLSQMIPVTSCPGLTQIWPFSLLSVQVVTLDRVSGSVWRSKHQETDSGDLSQKGFIERAGERLRVTGCWRIFLKAQWETKD